MQEKIKYSLSTFAGLFLVVGAFVIFRFVDDSRFKYHPFGEWEYTVINFKDTSVASLLNLAVFIVKPLIMICIGKLKNWFKSIKNGGINAIMDMHGYVVQQKWSQWHKCWLW